jgi:succinyl-CoA synthetase beta subunit
MSKGTCDSAERYAGEWAQSSVVQAQVHAGEAGPASGIRELGRKREKRPS